MWYPLWHGTCFSIASESRENSSERGEGVYVVTATGLLIGIFLGVSYLVAVLTGSVSNRLLRSPQFRKVAQKNFRASHTMRTALRSLEVAALD